MSTETIVKKFRSMEDGLRYAGRRDAKLVYICAPYDGDPLQYFCRIQDYCWTALRSHCVPVVPYLMYSYVITAFDGDAESLEANCAHTLLTQCDELWLFGGRLTAEMQEEINLASLWGIPVRIKHRIFE